SATRIRDFELLDLLLQFPLLAFKPLDVCAQCSDRRQPLIPGELGVLQVLLGLDNLLVRQAFELVPDLSDVILKATLRLLGLRDSLIEPSQCVVHLRPLLLDSHHDTLELVPCRFYLGKSTTGTPMFESIAVWAAISQDCSADTSPAFEQSVDEVPLERR